MEKKSKQYDYCCKRRVVRDYLIKKGHKLLYSVPPTNQVGERWFFKFTPQLKKDVRYWKDFLY